MTLPLAVLPRESWQAQPPKAVDTMIHPALYVFCMNTHTYPCHTEFQCKGTIRQVQEYHIQRQHHRDIRYNFMIGGDGNVYEGRGWQHKGLLPEKYRDYNDSSIVIGFIGDFTEVDLPPLLTRRRNELVNYGVEQNYIAKDFHPYEIFEKSKPNDVLDQRKRVEHMTPV